MESGVRGGCVFILQIIIISQTIRRIARFRSCFNGSAFLGEVSRRKGCGGFQVESSGVKYPGDIRPASKHLFRSNVRVHLSHETFGCR